MNSRYQEAKGLRVATKVLNLDMTEKFSNETTVDVPEDGVAKVFSLPEISGLSPTHFVVLRILGAEGKVLSSNFYWLSTRAETIDWTRSNWFTTPTLSYADFTSLSQLPRVKLRVSEQSKRQGPNEITHVVVENPTRNLAFFVRLKIDKGKGGKEILPVVWEENYISLLPGEKREIRATYRARDLGTTSSYVEANGWNTN